MLLIIFSVWWDVFFYKISFVDNWCKFGIKGYFWLCVEDKFVYIYYFWLLFVMLLK